MKTIFSENPENDLWRELLQYTYEANIKRYFEKNKIDADDTVVSYIIGSFLQAFEYYKASRDANLQIAPLLLYYGSSNLLYGMVSLISGKINSINNHGMNIIIPEEMNFISDVQIKFNNPKNGGVHVFAKAFGFEKNLTEFGTWNLNEFFDSIAEISQDYLQCYGLSVGRIAMIDVFNTPDGKVEKIYVSNDNKEDIHKLLLDVERFESNYLKVVFAKDNLTGKEAFVLRHKLNSHNITEQSYSGQPYFRSSHVKNGKRITIPTLLNMYISLFALSSLCRYFPEKWSPFILNDNSGEKLLIEKLLYYSRRMIPNLVLNKINDEEIQYSSNRYKESDKVKLVGEHQIQELVDTKINQKFEKINKTSDLRF